MCTQEVSGSAEEEYRPPSPKYDERNFFMSTQNPWVAARPAASPGKRSPAVPRSAAFATPPAPAIADGSGAAKRPRTAHETGARMADAAQPNQQGDSAVEAMPHGDSNAAVRVEDPLRKAPQAVQAAPVPPVSRPVMEKSQASALPAQRRPRLESQVSQPTSQLLNIVSGAIARVRLCSQDA